MRADPAAKLSKPLPEVDAASGDGGAQARDDLKRSEARYRNIFESAAVALWEVNFTPAKHRIEELVRAGVADLGAYLAANPAFVRELMDLTIAVDVNTAGMRMLEATSKDQLMGPIGKVWPVEAELDFAGTVMSALANRPTFELQTLLRTLSGRNIAVLYSVSYPPEAASLESIFVAFSDLTALNEASAALQEAHSELAHSTRLASIGELTASIAHEINQPLAGIRSNGQAALRLLSRTSPDIEGAITAIGGVVEETRRAATVISGIRAMARKETAEPEAFCINQLIIDTLLLFKKDLSSNLVVLNIVLDPNMVPIRADRVQIQQVLINLIQNAKQAMIDGGCVVRDLSICSMVEGGQIVISVQDSGPGVDPELRSRIFNAFVTSKLEGMGLGLSLCASIIDQHGGRIWSDFDRPGGGLFRFSVPADVELVAA